MEIVDYLRIARRRVWVLVGIPLAAAIITTLFVFLSPAQYTATATVNAPALVGGAPGNQFSGSQAVGQFASAFQSTAQGPAIRQQVSAATGVPLATIQNGLAVSQVGASATMQLVYESPQRKEIVPVLTAVTKDTLDTLFSSQVTLAQQQITDARADLTKSGQAITAWEETNKVVNPPLIYQGMVQNLNQLQAQQSQLQANGKPSGSAALSAQIAAVKSNMTKFSPLLAEYNVLAASRDSAAASFNVAQNNLLTARSQLNAADPSKVAFISGEHQVNDGSAVLTKVLPVTGAAIFAAVALIAILELLASGRLARSEEQARLEEEARAEEETRAEEEARLEAVHEQEAARQEEADAVAAAVAAAAPRSAQDAKDAEVAGIADDLEDAEGARDAEAAQGAREATALDETALDETALDEAAFDDMTLGDETVVEDSADADDEDEDDEADEDEEPDEDEASSQDSESFAYLLK